MVEYDLARELGRGNWVDAVAGEATILGYALHDSRLELKGEELARMVREIKYDSDNFSRVEAYAIGLAEELEVMKAKAETNAFIDSVPGEKSFGDNFQYDFLESKGRYQIKISHFDFSDNRVLKDKIKLEVEARLASFLKTLNCSESVEEVVHPLNMQKFVTTTYFDKEGMVLRKIIIHDHQDKYSKGFIEIFFFDDFSTAIQAWVEIKEKLILDQTRRG